MMIVNGTITDNPRRAINPFKYIDKFEEICCPCCCPGRTPLHQKIEIEKKRTDQLETS